MYADIIIDISHEQLDKTFQYKIPPELENQVEVGVLVNIPFGRGNRIITGYVTGITLEPSFDPERTKEIDSIVPGKVKAVGNMIKLAAWLRKNYGGTMNQALRTVIPVKEKVKRKEKKSVILDVSEDEAQEALSLYKKKNAKARVRLLTALITDKCIDMDIIKNKLNISMQTVNALEEQGVVSIETVELYRNPVKEREVNNVRIHLNEEQQKIKDSVISDYDNGIRKTYLIHGVTGSGKTVVYLELIEHVLNQGKQAIVLIPEIALTYQTVQRFYERFGDRVSILNSRMSKGERYDQFLRAMRCEIDIIIGPRSALFTPFPNLGLIVIDEEHDGAYRSEQSPKYHARETAVHIAKTCNASVVLGSATPSLESFYRTKTGEYQLFEMKQRAMTDVMPTVYVSDMREELKRGNRTIFSGKLYELIKQRLENKEQIMLFLNKRGYAGFVSCRSCGHVYKCPHCDISLTYHRNGKLVCHYCGYEEHFSHTCCECGSKFVSGFRAGTQQIEEMVKKIFPDARTLRMDLDTTSGKEGHEKILSAFANHEADILIGTQMIVKGHDFPDVTLVGIIAADMSLYAGDFRASEKTFQLLTQAAGRAGRDGKKGEVVIQTYSPEHFSIKTAAMQDYEGFYDEEIVFRQLSEYPPVSNILMISLMSKNEELLAGVCESVKKELPEVFKLENNIKKVRFAGPVDAAGYKRNDVYTKVIFIKCENYDILTELKDKFDVYTRDNPMFKQINVQYDFN